MSGNMGSDATVEYTASYLRQLRAVPRAQNHSHPAPQKPATLNTPLTQFYYHIEILQS
ncbi:hypothetical protein KM92DES2_11067 [uncultured Desulfovibrio sp.]|uniref:Uncharacterized protein n=1 Tax=uncultured Desulfovibrio sp. TaxID=167968 RepID=A0A212JGH0_9BACT|nr:hypothetical protein KM92DES2_11067 [uncultured Desulfovibrio sp.]